MSTKPETSTSNQSQTPYISEGAMTPVHVPKLSPEEKVELPGDTVEACEILVKDVLTNQTGG